MGRGYEEDGSSLYMNEIKPSTNSYTNIIGIYSRRCGANSSDSFI